MEFLNGSAEITELSNSDRSIIGANGKVAVTADSKSSGTLGVWMFSQSGSSILLGLSRGLVDDGGLNASSGKWIPFLHLVVISRGVDESLIEGKSPDFTIIMRLHIGSLFFALKVALNNGSISESNNEVSILGVNSSWEHSEVDILEAFHRG
jgi:hypothetical protein